MGPVLMTQTTIGEIPTVASRTDDDSWVVAADGSAHGCRAELRLLGVSPDVRSGRLLVEIMLYRRIDVSVDVFDLAGGLVRSLDCGRFPPGRRVVAWDGLDRTGEAPAPGLYQVLVQGEHEEAAWTVERRGDGV